MYQIYKRFLLIIITLLLVTSCGIYSFTGSSIPIGVETFQVDYFENTAGGKPGSTIEPGLDRDFTIALQDLIVNQTSLNLVNQGGDIIYSGEIVDFSVTPMAATAEIKAAQNRLTMAVMVNYENVLNEEDDIEKRFSFYYDFPGNLQVYDIKDAALEEIFERIIQDIFNETLAKW
ncbi:LPS assembly lipoprotein LptE [Flavobacteriaceae bacterium]|nr:LPS assembly lipoprotein LptE [Flavobacteriaceae bacterium]MDA9276317.1 LPS assembly lipoprotein LptE [Flavobacteriaceae bacterium]MDB3874630.1 LPS assembly lipoprotein LptE [Flavobacteriaceae bacterium]MDB3964077.1 LPS assembly lipoprotein LptE [Flavobacteriaceae bacterium]MDC0479448.1 LPS assembly lipoprotein LptE [Flavobacteriaceae bacterium]